MQHAKSLRRTTVALGLIAAYAALRLIFTELLDSLHPHASYGFEILFVGGVLALFRSTETTKLQSPSTLAIEVATLSLAGFGCYRGAVANSLVVPFDLRSPVTLVLLLGVGPILEEFIFRGAIWRLLEAIRIPPLAVWLVTSATFSFSHFMSWWRVPEEWHTFILFQTTYTLALGLYCGYRRKTTGSVVAPIFSHLAFNIGFYLGSWT